MSNTRKGYTLSPTSLAATIVLWFIGYSMAALPDFMFGWTADETRVQSGRPFNRTQLENITDTEDNDNLTNNLLKGLLYQGDIRLRTEEARDIFEARAKRRRKRKITTHEDKRWDLPIPYMFDEVHSFNETEKGHILNGIRHWEENTCIKFKELPRGSLPKTPTLLFQKLKDCWSYVGKEDAFTFQEISIGDECMSLGIVVHELGHAIGFWHEHARPDREDFIKINLDNVDVTKRINFMKLSWRYIDNLNVPYDVGSVMHYSGQAFTASGLRTVETLDPLQQKVLGQRQTLSFYDAKEANIAYCSNICSYVDATKPDCKHEGYPDPNDCSKCACPRGLAGKTCESVAPSVADCGGTIRLVGSESYTIVSPGYPYTYSAGVECNWLIMAPKNKQVRLIPTHSDFLVGDQNACQRGEICDEDYLEIKYYTRLAETGARFCCGAGPSHVIQSQTNYMMVLFRSKIGGRGGFQFVVTSGSCGGCADTKTVDQPACWLEESVTCTRTWTYYEYQPCSTYFNPFKWDCGQKVERRGQRVGLCYKKRGHCCGDFKLSGERCVLSDSTVESPTTSPVTTDTGDEGGSHTINNDVGDVGWTAWTPWSTCSQTCGGCGTKTRKRSCNKSKSSCRSRPDERQRASCGDPPCASIQYLCSKTRSVKTPCPFWPFNTCSKYETYMATCTKNPCCKGYSLKNKKCVKAPG